MTRAKAIQAPLQRFLEDGKSKKKGVKHRNGFPRQKEPAPLYLVTTPFLPEVRKEVLVA